MNNTRPSPFLTVLLFSIRQRKPKNRQNRVAGNEANVFMLMYKHSNISFQIVTVQMNPPKASNRPFNT